MGTRSGISPLPAGFPATRRPRLAARVRRITVWQIALVAGLVWLGHMALGGARVEELGEVGGYLGGVFILWSVCRGDPDLLRGACLATGLVFLWLLLV